MALFRRFSRPAGGETHIEATDARQGLRGRHVLWMLVAA